MTNPTERHADTSAPPEPAGGDVVDFLIGQHHTIRDLFSEVADSAGPVRRTAFERLVRLLAVHETVEEQTGPPTGEDVRPGQRRCRGQPPRRGA